jgi:hypothetical protein
MLHELVVHLMDMALLTTPPIVVVLRYITFLDAKRDKPVQKKPLDVL